ncbi:ribonuclease H-like domain-containing protein, partial [Tanacetum coccineum]
MPDENQILLKVPRHHNMYSFDMKTPTPAKGFACLIAKATSDESKLWHRRLGHINFKNLNKLVKGNLVRGLPSKMFDIDYLTDSMNYIPVSLENQANPHAGASEVTNSAGTSQTPCSNASEERDEDVELIVVPSTVKNTEEKAESRKSSTNSKKEEILTEPQQEKKASSTDTSEDNPKILAFRRELEEIALKHLGKVSENTSTSTPSVNTGSESVSTSSFDPNDSCMPELEIFHKSETGIFDEASYDEKGVITDFNSIPTEIEVSPTPTLRIHNIHPKSQDDPLVSLVQGLVTPFKTTVHASGEEQVEDISPTTLEAAKTLSRVASQKPKSIDKGRRYKRMKETKGKKVVTSLDFQKEVNTGAKGVNTTEGVNTGSIKVSTISGQVSTDSINKSIPSHDKGQRE